jgi:hypothetical protein
MWKEERETHAAVLSCAIWHLHVPVVVQWTMVTVFSSRYEDRN